MEYVIVSDDDDTCPNCGADSYWCECESMERIRQEQEAWERKFRAMSDEEQRAWLRKIDTKGDA